ncbi:hypothetical protein BZA70DRAFT_272478 [Myxozyma melibiosi]|uniref:C3HC-type domain-containing protein n=1 Tax=Myxozyma melibiosi TaxID=54550 RepID=A0ABR1FDH4_9ASCO
MTPTVSTPTREQSTASHEPGSRSLEGRNRIANVIQLIDPYSPAITRSPAPSSRTGSPAFVYSPSKRFKRLRAEKQAKTRKHSALSKLASSLKNTQIPARSLSLFDSDGSIRPHIIAAQGRHPAYTPYSRDALISRLSTFSQARDNWRYDPSEPATASLIWARAGWQCSVGQEYTVYCPLCKTTYCLDLSTIRNDKARPASEMTRSRREHTESCLWRRRVCDENLYGLKLSLDLRKSQREFLKRLKDAFQLSAFDYVEVPATFPEVDTKIVEHYLSAAGIHSLDMALGSKHRAFFLALVGWNVSRKDGTTISCADCFAERTIRNEGDGVTFDVIDAHYDYCPWIRPIVGSDPGWQLLLAILIASARITAQEPTDGSQSETWETDIDETAEDEQDRERKARVEKLRKLYVYRPKTSGKR